MEKLLIGLADFSIKKVVSYNPIRLEVAYKKDTLCRNVAGQTKGLKHLSSVQIFGDRAAASSMCERMILQRHYPSNPLFCSWIEQNHSSREVLENLN